MADAEVAELETREGAELPLGTFLHGRVLREDEPAVSGGKPSWRGHAGGGRHAPGGRDITRVDLHRAAAPAALSAPSRRSRRAAPAATAATAMSAPLSPSLQARCVHPPTSLHSAVSWCEQGLLRSR
jgi:hypothetical protein